MAAMILDVALEERLIAERRELGIDKFDEVWDGVYVMSPLADDEHQEIATFLGHVLYEVIQTTKLGKVRVGINLSDRPEDWTRSFRVPDVAVFLLESSARCLGAFWTGGPDLAVEILSEGESPERKLGFYHGLGTRELLIVNRDPWELSLYAPGVSAMELAQSAGPNAPRIHSQLNLSFALRGNNEQLKMIIRHDDGREWVM